DVRVNDFLSYDGIEFYQRDYGWAPRLVVTNPQGRVVFDDPIQLFGDDKSRQTGVLKIPSFGYTLPGGSTPIQMGANVALYPDAKVTTSLGPGDSIAGAATSFGPGGNQARNPVVELQLYVGDLGLSSGRAQNVNALDTSAMQPYYSNAQSVPVALGSRVQLPLRGSSCADPVAAGCFTISFSGLPQYSLFEVKKDVGVPLVYMSFALVMTGLLTKLYLRPLLEARQRRRASGGRRDGGGDDPPQPDPGGDGATAPARVVERELVGTSSSATSSGGT
ncbi:MAG TPA: cytochrome c biogenesis protein ResB, partial [Candidatus Dormibacteraeota bacterium]|nr:cytochrome c biogenesis protein ResB [Candidatus Dormibacteraeota bacterium]